MNTIEEIWKPVIGYEYLYEISNSGKVKATFDSCNGQLKAGRILKPDVHANGYLFVRLYKPKSNPKTRSVHSLVLEVFRGPRPNGMVSRHRNGNRQDNSSNNLVWGTSKQNYNDSRLHGTNCEGERNGHHVVTSDDVISMRNLRDRGATYKSLGEMFGTHWSNVFLITKNRTWKHLKPTHGFSACP